MQRVMQSCTDLAVRVERSPRAVLVAQVARRDDAHLEHAARERPRAQRVELVGGRAGPQAGERLAASDVVRAGGKIRSAREALSLSDARARWRCSGIRFASRARAPHFDGLFPARARSGSSERSTRKCITLGGGGVYDDGLKPALLGLNRMSNRMGPFVTAIGRSNARISDD